MKEEELKLALDWFLSLDHLDRILLDVKYETYSDHGNDYRLSEILQFYRTHEIEGNPIRVDM